MRVSSRETPVLVSDFDGTMTQFDFYRQALASLVPPGTHDYWDDFLAGRLTHFQALYHIFACIQADEAAMMTAAHQMCLEPKLHQAVTRLQQAGWEIVIASAGCEWYIQRLLAEQDVRVTLHANPGAFDPAHGLVMHLPAHSPFYAPTTGIDKEAVVRHAVEEHDCVAFAGDGKPDLPAALLVPPTRRFARGWLADYLHKEDIPFRAFACWSEIAKMLLEDDPC